MSIAFGGEQVFLIFVGVGYGHGDYGYVEGLWVPLCHLRPGLHSTLMLTMKEIGSLIEAMPPLGRKGKV